MTWFLLLLAISHKLYIIFGLVMKNPTSPGTFRLFLYVWNLKLLLLLLYVYFKRLIKWFKQAGAELSHAQLQFSLRRANVEIWHYYENSSLWLKSGIVMNIPHCNKYSSLWWKFNKIMEIHNYDKYYPWVKKSSFWWKFIIFTKIHHCDEKLIFCEQ